MIKRCCTTRMRMGIFTMMAARWIIPNSLDNKVNYALIALTAFAPRVLPHAVKAPDGRICAVEVYEAARLRGQAAEDTSGAKSATADLPTPRYDFIDKLAWVLRPTTDSILEPAIRYKVTLPGGAVVDVRP